MAAPRALKGVCVFNEIDGRFGRSQRQTFRKPFANGKLFGVRETTAPDVTRVAPTTLRTKSRLAVSPVSGNSLHLVSKSSMLLPASTINPLRASGRARRTNCPLALRGARGGEVGQKQTSPKSHPPPEIANTNAGNYAFACISLKGFRVNLHKSCRLLAVQQPLEDTWRTRGIEHGSHTP